MTVQLERAIAESAIRSRTLAEQILGPRDGEEVLREERVLGHGEVRRDAPILGAVLRHVNRSSDSRRVA